MRLLPTSREVANQFAESPAWFRLLIRFRFLLAGLYLLSLAGAIVFVALLAQNATPAGILLILLLAVTFFILQALFLAGYPVIHRRRPARKRHKFLSLAGGSLAIAALTFGLIGTVTSLCGHTFEWIGFLGADVVPLLILIGGPWMFWFTIFSLLWLQRWSSGFRQLYAVLVAGTFAEVLFTIPVDIMVRRRTGCYCEEGTFFALIAGGATALWTFGPGVAMLFLAVRFNKKWKSGICRECGYDLRGLIEPRCPECGTPFDGESPAMTDNAA